MKILLLAVKEGSPTGSSEGRTGFIQYSLFNHDKIYAEFPEIQLQNLW